jgi:hypothetical protein
MSPEPLAATTAMCADPEMLAVAVFVFRPTRSAAVTMAAILDLLAVMMDVAPTMEVISAQ